LNDDRRGGRASGRKQRREHVHRGFDTHFDDRKSAPLRVEEAAARPALGYRDTSP
jgi:hypothetical protein